MAYDQSRLSDHEHEHEHEHDFQAMELATNPTFQPPSGPRGIKILVSPGIGAGWVTYAPRGASDAFLVWMLTHDAMIRGLERREHKERLEEILRDFHHEAHAKFGVERMVVSRVGDLVVREVFGPFEIRETEGSERVVDVSRRRVVMM